MLALLYPIGFSLNRETLLLEPTFNISISLNKGMNILASDLQLMILQWKRDCPTVILGVLKMKTSSSGISTKTIRILTIFYVTTITTSQRNFLTIVGQELMVTFAILGQMDTKNPRNSAEFQTVMSIQMSPMEVSFLLKYLFRSKQTATLSKGHLSVVPPPSNPKKRPVSLVRTIESTMSSL